MRSIAAPDEPRLLEPASLPVAVLAAALVLLVALGAATHLAIGAARTHVVERALVDAERNAQKLAFHAQGVIERVDQSLLVAKSLRESRNPMSLSQLREAGLVATDLTRAVFLTDRRGVVDDSTSPDIALNVADEDDFKRHARRKDLGLTIGQPVPDVLGGGHVIPAMRRLSNESGQFDGVVIAWIDPIALTRGFGSADTPGVAASVIGQDGGVRSRKLDGRLSFGDTVSIERMLVRIEEVRRTLKPLLSAIDQRERFVASAPIEKHAMHAVVAASADTVMAEFAIERTRILGWAGSIGALLTLGTWLLFAQARRLDSSRREARRAKALYQATLDGGLDALWLLKAHRDSQGAVVDFRVTEANGRAAAMLRQPLESLPGRLATELVPSIQTDGLLALLIDVMKQGQAREMESIRAMPEARGRWLHYQVVPLEDGVALVVRDIDERKLAERTLAEREGFLRALLDALPVAVYAKSARAETIGQVLFWNRAAEAQYSLRAEDMIGRSTSAYLPATLVEAAIAQDREVVRSGCSMTFTDLRYEIGSSMRLLNFVKAPVRGADGDIDHVIVIAEDITEKRAAAAQLELVSRVVQETGDAVVLTDAGDRIVLANAAFASMTGWSVEEVIGQLACDYGMPPLEDEALPGVQEALGAQHRWTGEGQQRAADGSRFDIGLNVTAICDPEGALTHHARLFSDISLRKAQERKLAELARMDALTQLANRRHFEEQLVLAVARAHRGGQPLALLFVDLDGFKAVNDSLGHDAGDQLLVAVAQRLRTSVRATDLVSRLGGDEFTVILENAGSPADQQQQCQRLLEELSQPYLLGQSRVHSTPSMGLAAYRPGESLAELRQRADVAMYDAKRAGKGRLRVDRGTVCSNTLN